MCHVQGDFFDILPEIKDWVSLRLKSPIDISCLGNCFQMVRHLILTEDIFQGGGSGSLMISRHCNGDELKD